MIEQAAGRLANGHTGNPELSKGNNVVTLASYGLTKMDSSRAGEMLRDSEKNKGAATPLHDERALDIPKLADLGISEIQSHRWQVEADIPEA